MGHAAQLAVWHYPITSYILAVFSTYIKPMFFPAWNKFSAVFLISLTETLSVALSYDVIITDPTISFLILMSAAANPIYSASCASKLCIFGVISEIDDPTTYPSIKT